MIPSLVYIILTFMNIFQTNSIFPLLHEHHWSALYYSNMLVTHHYAIHNTHTNILRV